MHPYIEGFKPKIKINYQTEKYIAGLLNFSNKWPENHDFSLFCFSSNLFCLILLGLACFFFFLVSDK